MIDGAWIRLGGMIGLALLAGCSSGTETRLRNTNRYFYLHASARDGTVSCSLEAVVGFTGYPVLGRERTADVQLRFTRTAEAGKTTVSAQRSMSPVAARFEFPDVDSARLVLEGDRFADTLYGSFVGTPALQVFQGDWTCDGGYPLREDSLLQAAGWDRVESVSGEWKLTQEGNE